MSLKTKEHKRGTATTTDNSTYVDVASIEMASNGTVLLEMKLVGKDTSSGEIATNIAAHRAKRVAGVLSLVGSQVNLVTFTSGSDAGGGNAMGSCLSRLLISGNNIKLQVRGAGTRTIEWHGELIALKN